MNNYEEKEIIDFLQKNFLLNEEKKQTLEIQIVTSISNSSTKNRKKRETFLVEFPHEIKQHKVLFLSSNPLIEKEIGVDNCSANYVLKQLQMKKMNFSVFMCDVYSMPTIKQFAKKMSTQKLMPKDEYGNLIKTESIRDMIRTYKSFENGTKKICHLNINHKNSLLYLPIGTSANLEAAAKNAHYLLNNLREIFSNIKEIKSMKKKLILNVFFKYVRGESKAYV